MVFDTLALSGVAGKWWDIDFKSLSTASVMALNLGSSICSFGSTEFQYDLKSSRARVASSMRYWIIGMSSHWQLPALCACAAGIPKPNGRHENDDARRADSWLDRSLNSAHGIISLRKSGTRLLQYRKIPTEKNAFVSAGPPRLPFERRPGCSGRSTNPYSPESSAFSGSISRSPRPIRVSFVGTRTSVIFSNASELSLPICALSRPPASSCLGSAPVSQSRVRSCPDRFPADSRT